MAKRCFIQSTRLTHTKQNSVNGVISGYRISDVISKRFELLDEKVFKEASGELVRAD